LVSIGSVKDPMVPSLIYYFTSRPVIFLNRSIGFLIQVADANYY